MLGDLTSAQYEKRLNLKAIEPLTNKLSQLLKTMAHRMVRALEHLDSRILS